MKRDLTFRLKLAPLVDRYIDRRGDHAISKRFHFDEWTDRDRREAAGLYFQCMSDGDKFELINEADQVVMDSLIRCLTNKCTENENAFWLLLAEHATFYVEESIQDALEDIKWDYAA
jgi:hypothetical protein